MNITRCLRHWRLLFLPAALWLAGCVSQAAAPQAAPAWTVTLVQSGGVAGLHREVRAESSGQFQAMDLRSRRQWSGQLSDEERRRLAQFVAAPPAEQALAGQRCADCFQFDLHVQSDGRKHAVRLSSANVADSAYQPVVSLMMGLLQRAQADQ